MNLSGSGGNGPHALSLHVVRLARPTFDFDPPLRLDFVNDFRDDDDEDEDEEEKSIPVPSSSSSSSRSIGDASRSLRSDPLDALEGVPGLLSLRPHFGAVYLGEPFFAALSLVAAEAAVVVGGNGSGSSSSNTPASATSPSSADALACGGAADVSLRVELTADGEGKGAAPTVLTDTSSPSNSSSGPIALLAPGQRHDCLLRHDVRCVGRHTLVAAASYTVPATGERRHLSQYFSFSAAAPLGVRTKVRPAPTVATRATATGMGTTGKSSSSVSPPPPLPPRPAVLVEATIDNSRRGQCLSLEPPRFEPARGLEASLVSFEEEDERGGSSGSGGNAPAAAPPPPPPPIPPNGAASFVWLIRPVEGDENAASALAAAAASPAGLGRLDLRWRTPFGGAGRLQTQGIAPPPSASRRVSIGLSSVDFASSSSSSSSSSSAVPLEKPFEVVLSVTSRVDAAVGPLRLEAATVATASSPSPSPAAAAAENAALASSSSSSTSSSSSVVLLGPQARQVTSDPLKPRSSVSVSVTLFALRPGVQRLPPLRLVDGSDGSTLDVLSGWVEVS